MANLEALETKAYREEAIAALFFIASAVAFGAGLAVFGWLMLAKAGIDTLSAVAVWGRVLKASAKNEGSQP